MSPSAFDPGTSRGDAPGAGPGTSRRDTSSGLATTLAGASDSLALALAEFAETLRRSTVEVRTGGTGVGSGVVWHADGLIVTNAHVACAEHVVIVASEGGPMDGRVVAYDPRRDLAAIVTDAGAMARTRGVAAARIGDPGALRPGELVFALGNPLGIVGAVALGVVHAVEPGRRGRPRFIRADVRLAPGNSGGPLADARGRVIGINTMIAGGLGIAVPVTRVERFLADAGLRIHDRARPAAPEAGEEGAGTPADGAHGDGRAEATRAA